MKRSFIFLIISTSCIVPLAIAQWPPQQQQLRPPPGYQNRGQPPARPASDQRSPPIDPRGRAPGGGGMQPPNPYQRPDRPPGQANRMGPPPAPNVYPSMEESNPQVQAVALFLRSEEGQKDLAAAVDKEASVIAEEMIEVLQDDAAREDQSGSFDNGSSTLSSSVVNALCFIVAIFIPYRSI